MKIYPAHIKIDENKNYIIQPVEDHLRNVANIAADDLQSIELYNTAYLSGLIHDLGKYTDEFSEYLTKAINGEKVYKGSVNHTFAGVNYILNEYHINQQDQSNRYIYNIAELIAYVVGAHHSLFDSIDENGVSGFLHRTENKDKYKKSIEIFENKCASKAEINSLIKKASQELAKKNIVFKKFAETKSDMYFYSSMLTRLVLSAVIDGDRTDTSNFITGEVHKSIKVSKEFWNKYLENVETKINLLPCNTEIDKARRSISEKCRYFAANNPGIYRLNIPTGSGKTLSSLRYALAHAAKFGKKRIIYAAPFL